jgi:cytoskeletal protein CcmA (bactofilin family)
MRGILAAAIASLALGAPADTVDSPHVQLPTESAWTNEMWMAVETAGIRGTVWNDLFIVGTRLDLTGSFKDDVWAAGERIEAGGTFADDLRAAARTVRIDAPIGGDALIAAETLKVEPGSRVAGNFTAMAQTAILEGVIEGNLHILCRTLTLRGEIRGNATIRAEEIILRDDLRIDGDLAYTAPNELILPDEAAVGGAVRREQPAKDAGPSPRVALMRKILAQGFLFLNALAIGLLLAALAPRGLEAAAATLRGRFLACFLIGFGLLFAFPAVALFLAFSIVGLPAAAFLAGGGIVLFYGAKYVPALVLGGLVLRRPPDGTFRTRALCLAAGLALLFLSQFIPFLGGAIHLLFVLYGLGALGYTLFMQRRPETPPSPPPSSGAEDSSIIRNQGRTQWPS